MEGGSILQGWLAADDNFSSLRRESCFSGARRRLSRCRQSGCNNPLRPRTWQGHPHEPRSRVAADGGPRVHFRAFRRLVAIRSNVWASAASVDTSCLIESGHSFVVLLREIGLDEVSAGRVHRNDRGRGPAGARAAPRRSTLAPCSKDHGFDQILPFPCRRGWWSL